ncbi:MAG: septal ring lytic transglycosylase RlpA family protein [Candidatus Kapabacteria bacterium]|nr:septal ring lytic transglycosylase RlpA family protein [Candidatus Kapabacteria bacterium]
MSISLLVQAHDVPDAVAAAPRAVQYVEPRPEPLALVDVADGLASWYGGTFHGRRTASGKRYDMDEFTAAHKTLPFGTLLRVRNIETGKVVIVEVTDRGPFIRRRVVDLSRASARFLGVSVTPVQVDAISREDIQRIAGSDNGVALVLDADMQPSTIREEHVDLVKTEPTLRQALTNLSEGQHVRIGLTEKGSYTFQRVTLRSIESPLIASR